MSSTVKFLESVNAAYEKLKQDPKAWEALQKERQEWDATLMDGIPAEASQKRRKSKRWKRIT